MTFQIIFFHSLTTFFCEHQFLRYKDVDYPDRKKFALNTAQKILQHIAKTNAQSHLEYINRERAFENRGTCIFHAHRLPKWAQNDPKKFFQAADKYEGVGHRRYVEIEFALPNEFNLEMEKDWELMSELDKDEFLDKKIVREL